MTLTAGPRYMPGKTTGKPGAGWAGDTDQVSEASRISPPVVDGQRSGRDILVQVCLDAGVAVRNIRSSSHEVTVKRIVE